MGLSWPYINVCSNLYIARLWQGVCGLRFIPDGRAAASDPTGTQALWFARQGRIDKPLCFFERLVRLVQFPLKIGVQFPSLLHKLQGVPVRSGYWCAMPVILTTGIQRFLKMKMEKDGALHVPYAESTTRGVLPLAEQIAPHPDGGLVGSEVGRLRVSESQTAIVLDDLAALAEIEIEQSHSFHSALRSNQYFSRNNPDQSFRTRVRLFGGKYVH